MLGISGAHAAVPQTARPLAATTRACGHSIMHLRKAFSRAPSGQLPACLQHRRGFASNKATYGMVQQDVTNSQWLCTSCTITMGAI